ncbi:hypothetical protein ACFVH6_08625 [Spirillospora sp. NPDC127200]
MTGVREARFEQIFRAHSGEILGCPTRRTEPTEDAADPHVHAALAGLSDGDRELLTLT